MAPWPVIAAAGVVLGALSGLFGVGGSALACGVPKVCAARFRHDHVPCRCDCST